MKEPLYGEHDETMAALLLALETAPEVHMPDDFSARVMQSLPPANGSRLRVARSRAIPSRYGRAAVFASLLLLLLAMLAMEPAARSSSLWTTMQMVLLFQLAAYVVWIGVAPWRAR